MTQEEKELLLEDLCTRLPYGVFCSMGLDYPLPLQRLFVDKLDGILLDFYENGKDYQVYLSEVKPYLRPMSSMTDEEKKIICSMNMLSDIELSDRLNYPKMYVQNYTIETFDLFNKRHIDYRGLIEKGLALEAPEGMYK